MSYLPKAGHNLTSSISGPLNRLYTSCSIIHTRYIAKAISRNGYKPISTSFRCPFSLLAKASDKKAKLQGESNFHLFQEGRTQFVKTVQIL